MDAQERAHEVTPDCVAGHTFGPANFPHSPICRAVASQIRQAEQAAREKALEEVAQKADTHCVNCGCEEVNVELFALCRALKEKP